MVQNNRYTIITNNTRNIRELIILHRFKKENTRVNHAIQPRTIMNIYK